MERYGAVLDAGRLRASPMMAMASEARVCSVNDAGVDGQINAIEMWASISPQRRFVKALEGRMPSNCLSMQAPMSHHPAPQVEVVLVVGGVGGARIVIQAAGQRFGVELQ